MDLQQKKFLETAARKIRIGIIEGIYNAKSGHPGGSLSIADLLAYLYWRKLNVSPDEPYFPERDRLVLSKGHAAPALYSALAERGFFPAETLKTLRKIGSVLQGHPDMHLTKGVDFSTGSLGQGFSAACGIALSGKLDCFPYKVYAILGDGELNEGIVWESAMFAAHYKLDNLCVIVDCNGLQIDGATKDIMNVEPVTDKFAAFGWHVIKLDDAHDFDKIEQAFDEAEHISGLPVAIIQKSVKGKGVSFMENNAGWHGKAPDYEQYNIAIEELEGV
jgi:transketolase